MKESKAQEEVMKNEEEEEKQKDIAKETNRKNEDGSAKRENF